MPGPRRRILVKSSLADLSLLSLKPNGQWSVETNLPECPWHALQSFSWCHFRGAVSETYCASNPAGASFHISSERYKYCGAVSA